MCRCYGKRTTTNFMVVYLSTSIIGSCKRALVTSYLVNIEISHQGKTLTMIALILATKADKDLGFSNTTLIGGIAFVNFFEDKDY